MMTIRKSSSLKNIKYLLSIAALLLTFIVIAMSFNSHHQKVYTEVDIMASYKGKNVEEITTDLQKYLVHPKSAKEKKISARIYVQFVIDENGKVTDIDVVRTDIVDKYGRNVLVKGYKSKLNSEIDAKLVADLKAESIRAIKYLDDFTPAQKDGIKVKTQFTIPVSFIIG